MFLIIDGYNLLHASGILGRGRGPGFLERSRQALLNFLVESLDEKSLSRCTVVFDASSENVPRGRPRITTHRGIEVQYASGMPSADELIEELIKKHSSPRKLTVVSSDHRLHRAANRRKATAVDSDVWFRQIVRERVSRQRGSDATAAKPGTPASEFEVQWWLEKFGYDPAQFNEPPTPEPAAPTAPANPPTPREMTLNANHPFDRSPNTQPRKASKPPSITGGENPFPPGYGEDITDVD